MATDHAHQWTRRVNIGELFVTCNIYTSCTLAHGDRRNVRTDRPLNWYANKILELGMSFEVEHNTNHQQEMAA